MCESLRKLATREIRGVLVSCVHVHACVSQSETTGRLATRRDQESPGQGACVCPCFSKDKTTGGWLRKGAGEPWLGVAVRVRTHVCTHAHVFLKAAAQEGWPLEGPGESQPALCTCVWTMCLQQQLEWSCGPQGFASLHASNCGDWIQGPVMGKLCLSTAAGKTQNVHLYIFLLFSNPSCHRREQHEAVGAVCVQGSARCFCLCYLCGWPSIQVCRSCTCMHAGNTSSATLLAELEGMELWQPCLCQAAGFTHIP